MERTMKPWAGRFEKGTAEEVERFTASIAYDRRLAPYDIAGSMVHAKMLVRQGIISPEEGKAIVTGLEDIRRELEGGRFPFREELEDIHMNVEARLREKIGETAGKLHTARSRNDQVALDMRLFTKDAVSQTTDALRDLQLALVETAEVNQGVVFPGYTHLQRAQPVLLAHHLLAYFQMLQRDRERLQSCYERADVLPLGSGALAGVTFPIDRAFLAKELGFSKVSRNSLDAVSDRDFVLEYLAAAALAMMHLSRLGEELVLWSTAEFGLIELDDAYATGSSIMPQKKNPDVAELVRGKTGRVYGHLMALLATLKGLPLSYNRDLQEDKEGFFDTVDTLLSSLKVMAGMVRTVQVRRERAQAAAEGSYSLATDLADYLAKKGLPFREAHQAVGELVRYAEKEGKTFPELNLEEYQRFSPLFGADVLSLTTAAALEARDVPGGTAPRQVERAIKEAKRLLRI